MLKKLGKVTLLLLGLVACGHAAELKVLSSYHRPDPFGGFVASDRAGAVWSKSIELTGARGGYVSLQLVVSSKDPCSNCRLTVESSQPVEVYREWFHKNQPDGKYYPDALVPVTMPYSFAMPDPENVVPGQTVRAFWVDVWIGRGVKPGVYRGRARLDGSGVRQTVAFSVRVKDAEIPQQDVIAVDSNSYGREWLRGQYPKALSRAGGEAEKTEFHLLQQYYRIFYENRATYHVLGYGHAGYVDPGFAPELAGTGAGKHVVSWTKFDALFGPVLDGSAFSGTRRGPEPVPFVYLPINPDWPASYLWWGQPGYQAEFVSVVRQMEQHFREKGWTHTEFEVFFNQKKRYKGFPWDGDEIRFPKDNENFFVYQQLLQKALPADTPVHFIQRADSSWTMNQQMHLLENTIHLWCLSGGIFPWYQNNLPMLRAHGDTVWIYGGTPSVAEVSSAVTFDPLRAWIYGVDGFVRWLAVDPGPEPWQSLKDGGTETLVYPGDRFGMAAPVPSIRLKLQRNEVQDLDLLDEEAKASHGTAVKEEVVHLYDGTRLDQWIQDRWPLPKGKPVDWANTDIGDAQAPYKQQFPVPDPEAWHRVHVYTMEHADSIAKGDAR